MAVTAKVGRAVLELRTDQGTFQTDLKDIQKALRGFGADFKTTAAGVFSGQAAFRLASEGARLLVGQLRQLTIGGAGVADVGESFDHLTASAGQLGSVLLKELQQGTHNTVTNLQLMKMVNADLAADMKLSADQYRTLADGAFALAQATGGDVVTALETMNDAMLTGRTRALALLTGKIDETKAEREFAKAIGVSADLLSEEGKLQAKRIAILKAVGAATERLGEQTDGMDERVAQAQVFWSNFNDELGRAIATSPVLEAGMVAVKDALLDAFGGDQEKLIKAIAAGVDAAAISAVDFGSILVELGRHGTRTFTFLKDGILGLLEAQFRVRAGLRDLIPTEQYKREAEDLRARADSLRDQAEEAWQTQLRLEGAFNAAGKAIADVRARMADAASTSRDQAKATDDVRRTTERATTSTKGYVDETKQATEAVKARKEKEEALGDVLEDTLRIEERLAQLQQRQDEQDEQDLLDETKREIEAQDERVDAVAESVARRQKLEEDARQFENEQGERRMQSEGVYYTWRDERLEDMRQHWRQVGTDITYAFSGNLAEMMLQLQDFRDGAANIWRDIRRIVAGIMADMVADLLRIYIRRALAAIAGARLAQAIGLGVAGAATGGTGAAVAGASAVKGTAAGAGGGGSFLTNPAFWTNPWTIGIAGAGALLTWGIGKKGWFRGGEEALHVSPRRDSFFGQFGPPGTGPESGYGRVAAFMTNRGQPQVFEALRTADSRREWEAAQAAAVQVYRGASKAVRSFQFGGYVPPGVVMPAVLHGGLRGEYVVPGDRVQAAAPATSVTTIYAPQYIQGVMDANTVGEVHRRHIIRLQNEAVRRNTGGAATEITRMVRGRSGRAVGRAFGFGG